MSQVVDYYSPKGRDFMDCIVLEGATGIARYLTEKTPGDLRQITSQEVADAHAAGLEVHFFFEDNPPNPPASFFTFAEGRDDAIKAIARLDELGAPSGTVVYFAVDTNIDPALLNDYFNGVISITSTDPRIVCGAYGYQRFCDYARAKWGDVVGKHLAQTYGTVNGSLDLWQHEQTDICGVVVDLNECTVEGWRGDMTPEEAKAIAVQAIADAGLDSNTVAVIKKKLDYHVHLPGAVQTTQPLFPPEQGVVYAGSSADFSQTFWLYPDGVVRNQDGQPKAGTTVSVPSPVSSPAPTYPDLSAYGVDALTVKQMYEQGYTFDPAKGWVKT